MQYIDFQVEITFIAFKMRLTKIQTSRNNRFLRNVSILLPLKASENQMFLGVFRRYKMRTLARNGLHIT